MDAVFLSIFAEPQEEIGFLRKSLIQKEANLE